MKTIHTARVISMGGRNGRVQSDNGYIRLPISAFGTLGKNHREGASPEELFGAAYSAYFGALIELVAEQQKIELQSNFSVTFKISLLQDDQSKYHLNISLDCYLPNVSEMDANKLIQIANEICPYSNAIRDNVKVVFNWHSDEQ